MLAQYLEFIVPGQSSTLVEELRTFLKHREVVGAALLLTMLFLSALVFSVLENAMSVIFFHRVAIRRRHFLVSAVMPYLFILFLSIGLLFVTLVSGALQVIGTCNITILGQPYSLDQRGARRCHRRGDAAHGDLLVMPIGQLSARATWWGDSHRCFGRSLATSSHGTSKLCRRCRWFTALSPRQ